MGVLALVPRQVLPLPLRMYLHYTCTTHGTYGTCGVGPERRHATCVRRGAWPLHERPLHDARTLVPRRTTRLVHRRVFGANWSAH